MAKMISTVYVGMGSNQGNRKKNLERALSLLRNRGLAIKKKSSIYETSPVGPRQRNFLNAVIQGRTSLPPAKFLEILKSIESEMGRKRTKLWGPRPIDLDILLFGNKKFRTNNLTLPHPRMQERKFVLVPLKEIAPRMKLPKLTDPSQKVRLYSHG